MEGGRGGGVRQQLCAKRKGRGWGIRHDKRFVQGLRVGRLGINQTTGGGWGGGVRKQLGLGEGSDVTTALYRGGCIQHRTSKGIPCMRTHRYHNLVSKPYPPSPLNPTPPWVHPSLARPKTYEARMKRYVPAR